MAYAQGLIDSLHGSGVVARLEILECDQDLSSDLPGRLIIDGLLLPRFAHRIDELVQRRAVALMHHTASRARDSVHLRDEVVDALKSILPRLSQVVTTSESVAHRLIQEFSIISSAITVVSPGIGPLCRATPRTGGCSILSTGVLTRRKRYDMLIRMLSCLLDLDWHLTIAGDAARDPSYADELGAIAIEAGLQQRITFLPDSAEGAVLEAWQHASLFISMTRWEGYPAATAQALRRGIPVLVTEAAASLLTQGAGVVLPDDDERTASKVLRRAIYDFRLRQAMADAAWQAGQALPDWNTQARLFAAAMETNDDARA